MRFIFNLATALIIFLILTSCSLIVVSKSLNALSQPSSVFNLYIGHMCIYKETIKIEGRNYYAVCFTPCLGDEEYQKNLEIKLRNYYGVDYVIFYKKNVFVLIPEQEFFFFLWRMSDKKTKIRQKGLGRIEFTRLTLPAYVVNMNGEALTTKRGDIGKKLVIGKLNLFGNYEAKDSNNNIPVVLNLRKVNDLFKEKIKEQKQ